MGKLSENTQAEEVPENDANIETMKEPVTEKEEYLSLCQLVNPISQPLASRKLAKKLYKLVKKSAKEKGSLRHGLSDVMKAIRKNEKGILILAGNVSPIDVYSHIPALCEEKRARSGLVVQIPEEPSELVSVKVFIKTSNCPKRVELCSGCSNKIKQFLCGESSDNDLNDELNVALRNSDQNHVSERVTTNSTVEGVNGVLNGNDSLKDNNNEQNSIADINSNEVVNETQEFINCDGCLVSDVEVDSVTNDFVEPEMNNLLEEIDLASSPIQITTCVPPALSTNEINIEHQKNQNNEINIDDGQHCTSMEIDKILDIDGGISESVTTNNLMKDISIDGAFENLNSAISTIKEQQIKINNAADDEAIEKCGMGNCEVIIKNSDFDRLAKIIESGQRRKNIINSSVEDDDINAELDRQIRTVDNLLRGGNRKSRKDSISSPKVYDTECEDSEHVNDENENRSSAASSVSDSQKSKNSFLRKRNLRSLPAKQSKNSSENGSNGSSDWLSKNNAEKSEASTESPDESDSDTDDTFVEAPKLTPAQRQADAEVRRLLRDTRVKISDSDGSDATIIKTDGDDSDSDSDRKNRRAKSKRLKLKDLNSDENDVSNKPSSSKIISSDEPKKRMTAKKSHIGKNLDGPNRKKRRIIYSDDDGDVHSLDGVENNKISDEEDFPKQVGRRKVIPKEKLAQATKDAEKAEKERRKRLEEKQREFNGIELTIDEAGNASLINEQSIPKLKNVILDRDSESEAPVPVRVHPFLVKVLKKHQAEGIQFLYNCTIESLSRLDEPGGGAILGHCMGLGKTLQIIAFLHTILTHEKISKKINKVLVVVPKNVVLNWMNEFEKWLYGETDSINYSELDSWRTYEERLKAIKRWINFEGPSVLIIGYELFRILTFTDEDKANMSKNRRKNVPLKKKLPATKKLDKLRPQFCEYLQNGEKIYFYKNIFILAPHLLVCDEGHKLKSPSTALFYTIDKIKTLRRICMTGTPLQNNLEEYYCMVNFVKPNLLGSLDEFKSRFSNIIKCGRSKDASAYDVRRMRRRCHVLFDRLKCVLDWRDYSVLRNSLPPKQEYVINIRLTKVYFIYKFKKKFIKVQIDLYKKYLDFRNLTEEKRGTNDVGVRLLYDHLILYRVWTHPYLLVEHVKREQYKSQNSIDDFIDDDYDSEAESNDSDDIVAIDALNDNPSTSSANNKNNEFENPLENWAKDLVSEKDRNNFALSNKLLLLIEIIKKCEKIGDKL
ncbi:unnamed protein product [Meloidogyne enterolobii]|uniref:Uncharacterized protein n=1 Tax=Meloidogyne enterolobii TaxID=390850 RepID=A0ACB0XPK6_MELEN